MTGASAAALLQPWGGQGHKAITTSLHAAMHTVVAIVVSLHGTQTNQHPCSALISLSLPCSGGQVVSTWMGRTVIRTAAKLAYHHAQAIIDGASHEEDLPVQLHNGHSWQQVRGAGAAGRGAACRGCMWTAPCGWWLVRHVDACHASLRVDASA